MAKPGKRTNAPGLLTNQLLESIMAKADLTAQRLRELLDYDPATGIFTWRVYRGWNAQQGDVAGSVDRSGYRVFFFAKHGRQAGGRLAWLHVHGRWPNGVIDHINGMVDDNRIANLRDVTHAQNLQNIKRHRPCNESGFLGVTTSKNPNGGFAATIECNKQRHYLGFFKTPEEAHAAYLKAKRELHSTCTI
jgi:hypothetical protein